MSIPERVLWSKLRADRCFGIKFRRQHPMGEYIADFYCPDAGLVIEVDGRTHAGPAKEHDDRRDAWMQSEGVEVLRVPAWKISKDVELVVREILVAVERRMDTLHPGRFAEKKAAFLKKRAVKKMKKKEPPPQPSPTGRGGGSRMQPAARTDNKE